MSLAGLAERTAYSKSSWDRYLNGKALPPRHAVQALCRLARTPDERYVALWEIAESEWRGRAARTKNPDATKTPEAPEATETPPPAPAASRAPATDTSHHTPTVSEPGAPESPAPEPGTPVSTVPGPASVGSPTPRTTIAVACAVIAVVAVVVVAAILASPPPPSRRDDAARALPAPSPFTPLCQGAACEGRNPVHMHCAARPRTLASYQAASGARLELRFSEECGAGWARMWRTRVGDRLDVTTPTGRTASARVADEIDAAAYVHTAILPAAPETVLRACFHSAASDTEECFDVRTFDRTFDARPFDSRTAE